jgi:hypothetical protein
MSRSFDDYCGFGRPLRGLDFAGAKSACAEIERSQQPADEVARG